MKKLCVLLFIISVAISCYAIDTKTVFSFSKNVIDPSVVPTTGLEAAYLYNDWTLSDASHVSIWNDSSGKGHNATNSVLANQLKIDDYGVTRDTAQSWLQTDHVASISLGSSYSFVIKWRYNVDDSNYYSVMYFGNPSSGVGWMDSEFGYMVFRGISAVGSPVVATASTDIGKTITTIITSDGLSFNSYNNGTMCAGTRTNGVLTFDSPGYLTIGNSHNAGWALNYGTRQSIRAIWIFKRVLTSDEIMGANVWKSSI